VKILALVAESRLPNNDEMYKAMQSYADVEVVKVDKAKQKKLKRMFKNLEVDQYDRVILDLHFKRIVTQARFIRTIPKLAILEEDACQNYIESSKWFGKFLPFYKKLNDFRLICTSVTLAERFRSEGIDAYFIEKGYDQNHLKNLCGDRDIALGFIGRTASKTYSKRNELLMYLEQRYGLQLIRTEPGKAYLMMLNRINIFISADIGLGEYMVKNFEAMACGCLVVAYRQGDEEDAMGLKDMENIVLYRDKRELIEKLEALQQNPSVAKEIAKKGQALAEANHGFNVLAKRLYCCLEKEFTTKTTSKSWLRGMLPF